MHFQSIRKDEKMKKNESRRMGEDEGESKQERKNKVKREGGKVDHVKRERRGEKVKERETEVGRQFTDLNLPESFFFLHSKTRNKIKSPIVGS